MLVCHQISTRIASFWVVSQPASPATIRIVVWLNYVDSFSRFFSVFLVFFCARASDFFSSFFLFSRQFTHHSSGLKSTLWAILALLTILDVIVVIVVYLNEIHVSTEQKHQNTICKDRNICELHMFTVPKIHVCGASCFLAIQIARNWLILRLYAEVAQIPLSTEQKYQNTVCQDRNVCDLHLFSVLKIHVCGARGFLAI